MQSVFNRERNKFRRSYEKNWKENGPGAYHQHFQRDDWYWKAEQTFRDQWNKNNQDASRENRNSLLSHHYSVLGLDRYSQKSNMLFYPVPHINNCYIRIL